MQLSHNKITTKTRHFTRLTLTNMVSLVVLAIQPTPAHAKDNEMMFYGDFRARYESVQQSNTLRDAQALTLRSRVGLRTASLSGFSALIEIENTTELIDDFSVPPAGVRAGQYSVIADPKSTEVDQAFIKYTNNGFTTKLGRQVLTLDGHRFVGHVGWRQDRQTFDGVNTHYNDDKFSVNASYIKKRNRIFANEADIDSKDILLNTSYKTSYGKFTAYSYLLDPDNNNTSLDSSLNTYGLSFNGKSKLGDNALAYHVEYATQESNDLFDTNYLALEVSLNAYKVTAKAGYESLGSDDGQKGFTTPLATLHKFNGWADQFLITPNAGLEDLYLGLSGSTAGGKWTATYHSYTSDITTNSGNDLGNEINLMYSHKFANNFSGGIKLANYSAGNRDFGKVDTDKVWLWAGYKF